MAGYLEQIFSLDGKTAVVTGATGGLGRSMAVALAKAGASIVSIEAPNDPNSSQLDADIKSTGRSISKFECDLTNLADLRSCYAKIWEAGIISYILLNCAGVMRRNACEDATDSELDLLFEINVKATYVSCQEFGRKLLELKRPGKIVNIASVTAFQANKNTSIYAATKGAVVQLTKAFSNEWASKGIQVNAISPGFMTTAMTEAYAKNEEISSYLMGRVPAARWGLPDDLVPALLFLAAPANTFTCGTSITVDGGFCGK